MIDVSICLTYFKSLELTNLRAALYSVSRQDLSRVKEIIIVDNDTEASEVDIQTMLRQLAFPVPVLLRVARHRDVTKTHSWSTNEAVRLSTSPWVLFTRGDYLLDFETLSKSLAVVDSRPENWDGFVTGNGYHLHVSIDECEATEWRQQGLGLLRITKPGVEFDYTRIDSGVWLARRSAFDRVGGLDEQLTAWGHAQTHFQHKLYATGTEFVRIPEVLFYHPLHGAPRDIELAHRQLRDLGVDPKEMWARYDGVRPYG